MNFYSLETDNGLYPTIRACSTNNYFNEKTQQCEDPCTWNWNADFDCTINGRFPDPFNCRAFYECVIIDGEVKETHQTKKLCPPGYHWKPKYGDKRFRGGFAAPPVPNGKGECVLEEKSQCVPEILFENTYNCAEPSDCSASFHLIYF